MRAVQYNTAVQWISKSCSAEGSGTIFQPVGVVDFTSWNRILLLAVLANSALWLK